MLVGYRHGVGSSCSPKDGWSKIEETNNFWRTSELFDIINVIMKVGFFFLPRRTVSIDYEISDQIKKKNDAQKADWDTLLHKNIRPSLFYFSPIRHSIPSELQDC